MSDFYVYVHRKATTNEIFYVGKGKNNRAWELEDRNNHWHNTVNKHGFKVDVIQTPLQEWYAFELEVELIALYGRSDLGLGPLVNMTDGGDGASGFVHTDETKQMLSVTMKKQRVGWPLPLAAIEKAAEINKTRIRSPEEMERRRLALLGNTNGSGLKGIAKSDKAKENMKLGWISRKESSTQIQDLLNTVNTQRWKCTDCGKESTSGPLVRHLISSGHLGKERIL